MVHKYVEKYAVLMFSIGLLSLVLGIFAMSESPTFGASKPAAPVQTQSVTLNYLTQETGLADSPCGWLGGYQIDPQYSWITLAETDGNGISGNLNVQECHVTFKVVK